MGISDQRLDIYIWRIWSLMTLRWAASSTKATPTSPWTSHPLWSTANISCLHLSLFSYRSIHLLVNMLPLFPFNHLFPTCTYSTGIPWRSSCSKSERDVVLCCVMGLVDHLWPICCFGAILCIVQEQTASLGIKTSLGILFVHKKKSEWTVRGCFGGSTVVDA